MSNREFKELEYQYFNKVDSTGDTLEVRHGFFRMFFPNGQINWDADFVEGEANGALKVYFENGQIEQFSNWENGKEEGSAKYYFNTGALHREFNYHHGMLDGDARIYYRNGQISKQLKYKNGLLWEVTVTYDSLGHKRDEMAIKDGDGILNAYFPDGSVQLVTEYKNGTPNGKCTLFYPTGKLRVSFALVNDKKEGKFLSLYEDGRTAAESYYRNDFIVGVSKRFNKSGVLVSEVHYKETLTPEEMAAEETGYGALISRAVDPAGITRGVMHGSYKTWFDNGKIKSEEYYKNGHQDSIYRTYYENGALQRDMYIDDNLQSGIRYDRRYDKNGRLISIPDNEQFQQETDSKEHSLLRKLLQSKPKADI